MGRVDPSEDQLPGRVAGQIEAEHRFLELTRLHQCLYDGEPGASRGRLEAKAQDSIEGHAAPILQAARVVDLCEGEVGQRQPADADCVLAKDTAHVSGAISDDEGCRQGLVGRRIVGVVEGLPCTALLCGHPQIGRPRVKDDSKWLAGCADENLAVVGHVHIVLQDYVLGLSPLRHHAQARCCAKEHLDTLCLQVAGIKPRDRYTQQAGRAGIHESTEECCKNGRRRRSDHLRKTKWKCTSDKRLAGQSA
mmetsp:Transcript_65452/g.213006  ORF Transcript_65452/g.213006 Transcript_65452/m.213006 type:complete len:250 (-) Transcript_65452:77-826(-)